MKIGTLPFHHQKQQLFPELHPNNINTHNLESKMKTTTNSISFPTRGKRDYLCSKIEVVNRWCSMNIAFQSKFDFTVSHKESRSHIKWISKGRHLHRPICTTCISCNKNQFPGGEEFDIYIYIYNMYTNETNKRLVYTFCHRKRNLSLIGRRAISQCGNILDYPSVVRSAKPTFVIQPMKPRCAFPLTVIA